MLRPVELDPVLRPVELDPVLRPVEELDPVDRVELPVDFPVEDPVELDRVPVDRLGLDPVELDRVDEDLVVDDPVERLPMADRVVERVALPVERVEEVRPELMVVRASVLPRVEDPIADRVVRLGESVFPIALALLPELITVLLFGESNPDELRPEMLLLEPDKVLLPPRSSLESPRVNALRAMVAPRAPTLCRATFTPP